jgi:hypothetical protein
MIYHITNAWLWLMLDGTIVMIKTILSWLYVVAQLKIWIFEYKNRVRLDALRGKILALVWSDSYHIVRLVNISKETCNRIRPDVDHPLILYGYRCLSGKIRIWSEMNGELQQYRKELRTVKLRIFPDLVSEVLPAIERDRLAESRHSQKRQVKVAFGMLSKINGLLFIYFKMVYYKAL